MKWNNEREKSQKNCKDRSELYKSVNLEQNLAKYSHISTTNKQPNNHS